MGIADFMGSFGMNGVGDWLGDPQNQAKLFKAGQALDTMSRAGVYDASGRPLGPGVGGQLAEQGLADLQPKLQQKSAADAVQQYKDQQTKAGQEKKTKEGLISSLLGSDLDHINNPNVGGFKLTLDPETGQVSSLHVQATPQKDIQAGNAILAQQQAGVVQYPQKASSYLGSGQSPF